MENYDFITKNINVIALVAIALVNLYTAIVTSHTNHNMAKVETATNSMKDALVASTAKASMAEGKAVGLQQGRSEVNHNGKKT